MTTATTLDGVLLHGVAGSRPAASAVAKGTIYSATDTGAISQSDGVSVWATFATTGSGFTNPMTTTGDMIYSSSGSTGARLAIGAATTLLHGGTTPAYSGVALADILTAAIDALMPWHIQIVPMISTPDATTGTWALIQFSDNGLLYPFVFSDLTQATQVGFFNSTSAQNDAFSYTINLAAGTWDCNVWIRKSSNTGIVTLNQDGSSMGTADTYAASPAAAKLSITGWSVSTSGKHTMQFKMATKNASSANYLLEIFGIEFRRTA